MIRFTHRQRQSLFSIRTKRSLTFLVLLFCFATTASAKLTNHSQFVGREKPLFVTIVVAPYITDANKRKQIAVTKDYEANFNSFSFAGNSYFSMYDINKIINNGSRNMINFNKVKIEKAVTFTFLPLFDYSENSVVDDYGNDKSKTPTITLLQINFPFL